MALPERTCVGCRTRAPKTAFVRFVVDGGVIALDERQRLPGRGAWVHPSRTCFENATRRKAWARAFKSPGIVIDVVELCDRLGIPA